MLLNGCSIRPAIVHLRCSSISYTSTTATLSFYHTTHFYTMASSATPAALRNRKNNNTTASSSPSRAHSSHSGHSHSGGGGHSHTHGGAEEADALLAALRGSSDPGSRITLIGLGANVGLTGVKGVAGWFLGSAALLADAAHSGSDLLADIVTLTTYRMSRKPVSENYPYGYGKYESLGSLVVSFLLIGTALGIGFHSYHLLLQTLSTSLPNLSPSLLASLDALPHGHSHGPDGHGGGEGGESVDPRAMWFAAGSIVVKEWLYRATLKVAKSEHSNVLLANAYHHRSDAFGSLVAVGAIGGAWLGYPMLDPLGGLLVSGMILKQGAGVGVNSLKELVDQVTDPSLPPHIHSLLLSLRDPSLPSLAPYTRPTSSSLLSKPIVALLPSDTHGHDATSTEQTEEVVPSANIATPTGANLPILSIPSIRTFASGPSLLIDVQITLPSSLTLKEVGKVEDLVKKTVKEGVEGEGKGKVREVVVRIRGEEEE